MQENALLEMRDISKEFPGVKALDKVSLTVRPGTVHALMGENGAGKSTLMKCLFGIYSKDGGTIVLDGKEVNFKSSKEALENGVAMVHQELNQALTRSVQDNLWLGRYPTVGGIMVSEGIMRKKTKEIFSDLEVEVDPSAIMRTLPVSKRQMVELPLQDHCVRRAYLLPDGDRGGASLPHHQYAAGPGLRHHLHQP